LEPEPPGTLRASPGLYMVLCLYLYLLQLQQLLLEIIKHFNIEIYCVLLAVYIRMSSSNIRTRAPTVNSINLLLLLIQKSCLLWCRHLVI